jgi:hypothetical protein
MSKVVMAMHALPVSLTPVKLALPVSTTQAKLVRILGLLLDGISNIGEVMHGWCR